MLYRYCKKQLINNLKYAYTLYLLIYYLNKNNATEINKNN